VTVRPVGRHAALVELDSTAAVHRLWRAVRAGPPPGVIDLVPGALTLLVVTAGSDAVEVASQLPTVPSTAHDAPGRTVTVDTVYDGPDLDEVAELAGVSREEVVRRHAASAFRVAFIGFSPGFAYLSGGDPLLDVPRLASPRPSVPAGSVALAAGMCAVYPQSTPGGWRLLGRTDAPLFDPRRYEPSLLSPGDTVRFRPVARVGPAPGLRAEPAGRPGAGQPAVEVLAPGPLLTLQDEGRAGWAHVGVSPAGAADRGSARAANRLVGNPDGAAVLEATLGGCRLRMRADRAVAFTGGDAAVTVDGIPARSGARLPLRAGAEIAVGPCRKGLRVYVAVEGGFEVPPVLGSRSTDTLSGLGPARLTPGDVLALGFPSDRAGGVEPLKLPAAPSHPSAAGAAVRLQAELGPQHDRLSVSGRRTLREAGFTVATTSARTGVRLDGPVVELARAQDIPSQGVVAGAVQLPPGGRPIVLMRNHPATGGYPVVAVVGDEGVDVLAQCPPGTEVRFLLS